MNTHNSRFVFVLTFSANAKGIGAVFTNVNFYTSDDELIFSDYENAKKKAEKDFTEKGFTLISPPALTSTARFLNKSREESHYSYKVISSVFLTPHSEIINTPLGSSTITSHRNIECITTLTSCGVLTITDYNNVYDYVLKDVQKTHPNENIEAINITNILKFYTT